MITTNENLLKETIDSIETAGGELWKKTDSEIYFHVKNDSDLGKNKDNLRGVRDFLISEFNLKLKVHIMFENYFAREYHGKYTKYISHIYFIGYAETEISRIKIKLHGSEKLYEIEIEFISHVYWDHRHYDFYINKKLPHILRNKKINKLINKI